MLILITGLIGSGKSETERILCEILGQKNESFADPLKQIALILGFKKHEVYGTQAQKLIPNDIWGISGRTFCQKFGTEVCRDTLQKIIPEMKDVWIRIMDEKIKTNRNIIISDGRFPDELALVRKHKGIIIKIERDTHHAKDQENKHSSENQYLDFDYVIDNNGTIDDLRIQLINFINFIKKSGTLDSNGYNTRGIRTIEKELQSEE
jgi:hypothetical protein